MRLYWIYDWFYTAFLSAVLSFLVLFTGCGSGIGIDPPTGGPRATCYYMNQQDFDEAVALFTEVARYYPRELWLSWNGYPCDMDLPRSIPREDCVQCTEAIFELAGW